MPSSRTSSRLAQRQQKKLLRQTIMFVVAAVVLGVVFVFFILPRSVNLFFTLTSGNQDALSGVEGVPPQVPVFSAPPSATSSAQIDLNGYAEAKTEVVLVINGEQKNREKVQDDGTFVITADLEDGDNMITAFSVNDEGLESAISRSYTIVKDNQPPKLEVITPQDGQAIELSKNQTTSITGQSDPGSQVQLNGRSIFVGADGAFSSSYQLAEGENVLTFTARDQAGNTSEKIIKVTYRP